MKYVWNFCLFWWDFVVGDSIALAVGALLNDSGIVEPMVTAESGVISKARVRR